MLVHILSLLDPRDAARTGALSKRWRYVWAYLSDLDFDASSTLYTLWNVRSVSEEYYATQDKAEACKYVCRVTHVVRSCLAPGICRFRVHFPLGVFYGHHIQTWVNFTMRKNVKELELNFSGYTGGCPQYPFYLDSFRRYAGFPSVHTLVSLSLVGVSISGYFLESVLFNFPNLERLTMKYLKCGQGDLTVVGDLLKLRYLEISSCQDYSKLEISARNLVSIGYGAHNQDVNFRYVPLLSEASFSGPSSLHWIHILHHSGFLSQLTKLKLTILIQDFMQYSTGLPQFGNLKQFEVLIFDPADKGLLTSTHFIYACPVLHKFKQQRLFIEPTWQHPKGFLGGRSPKVAKKHHHSLKIFEMVGFGGAPADTEFVFVSGTVCCNVREGYP